jgi:hypothetical protein
MRQTWLRALPALIVAALLVLGLLASSRGVRARGGSELNAYYYPRCDLVLQSGGGGDSVAFNPGGGVTQPFTPTGNVSACSVSVDRPDISYGVHGEMEVFLWDPGTLAPDPTTVALRSRAFQNSEMAFFGALADFGPPIVTRNVPHLADGRGGMLAIDYQGANPGAPHKAAFQADGAASTPIAYQYAAAGPRLPISGNHPVLSHAVCGGDAALQDLYVAQSVMTTNFLMANQTYEIAQTFRVPVKLSLRWVELAFGANSGGAPGLISIVDPQGATTPPALLPTAMVDATFTSPYPVHGEWRSHFDFDHTVELQPNHDYLLVVRTPTGYGFYCRNYTGSETGDFFTGVGGMFYRPYPSGAWYPMNARALCFRVIGDPIGPLGVTPEPPAPASGALRLRVAPNPSRGASFVNWSGASGALRFDVLDERGRRVAAGRGEAGTEGRWLWRGAHDDGRPLPAGVYFLRAQDDAGHAAVERVVLVK